jgi:hypothetical protein
VPDKTITDEELAQLRNAIWSKQEHASAYRVATATLDRLIAALRAERAEVERLKSEINERDRIVHQAFRGDA